MPKYGGTEVFDYVVDHLGGHYSRSTTYSYCERYE